MTYCCHPGGGILLTRFDPKGLNGPIRLRTQAITSRLVTNFSTLDASKHRSPDEYTPLLTALHLLPPNVGPGSQTLSVRKVKNVPCTYDKLTNLIEMARIGLSIQLLSTPIS